mmetsp:Transcript_3926/g.8510  ORF Transcript_3926/g.8510 Transcript_3926/m.8510 type:complete len:220 (+) Transcript_3926:365-1024(+)
MSGSVGIRRSLSGSRKMSAGKQLATYLIVSSPLYSNPPALGPRSATSMAELLATASASTLLASAGGKWWRARWIMRSSRESPDAPHVGTASRTAALAFVPSIEPGMKLTPQSSRQRLTSGCKSVSTSVVSSACSPLSRAAHSVGAMPRPAASSRMLRCCAGARYSAIADPTLSGPDPTRLRLNPSTHSSPKTFCASLASQSGAPPSVRNSNQVTIRFRV